MSFLERATAAYQAFTASPNQDAVRLRTMPTAAPGPRAPKPIKRTGKRIERLAFDYRRWTPSDVEIALSTANGSGVLTQVAAIAAWVKSNPVVFGVMEGRTSTPWLPYGVKYSNEAAAWLQGSEDQPGWREKIADPSELEAIAIDDYVSGWGVGIFIWNEQKQHPELVALDNAGLRYLPGENRYQYHGYQRVFDVTPGDGIWVLKTRVKSDPWRDGAWHKIAYAVMDALQAEIQRATWMHVFSMPTILAKYPTGASENQKITFTQSILGAALRVIGVTPGYDLDFKQASAEGAQSFKDAEEKLERQISLLVWGTIGLISGGSGFSNSDLFEASKAQIVSKEAWRQDRFENEQVWPVALDWAARAGHISRAATRARIKYNPETPAVILKKALAAKALVDAGYTQDEAQKRAGIERQAQPEAAANAPSAPIYGYHISAGIPTKNEVRTTLGLPTRADGDVYTSSAGEAPPAARAEDETVVEEAPEEPGYSESLAARLTELGHTVCPHERAGYCRSCGVRQRFEERNGAWVKVWHPIMRGAA